MKALFITFEGLDGSGKSTPWNALCHLWYPGYTPKGGKYNELLNIHNPQDMSSCPERAAAGH